MKSATLSDCGNYRYLLTRTVAKPEGSKRVTLLMLNPSTADALDDDPTVRKCLKYAKAVGGKELQIINLFGFRATNPTALRGTKDPIGKDNDRHIRKALDASDMLILAYGAFSPRWWPMQNDAKISVVQWRLGVVHKLIDAIGVQPHALRLTKHGQPSHPLYLPDALRPRPVTACDGGGYYEFADL